VSFTTTAKDQVDSKLNVAVTLVTVPLPLAPLPQTSTLFVTSTATAKLQPTHVKFEVLNIDALCDKCEIDETFVITVTAKSGKPFPSTV